MKNNKSFQKGVYSNPINLPVSGHKQVTCHYPLRIDTYSGCYHNCRYCYGKSVLKKVNAWSAKNIKVANINDTIEKLEQYLKMDTNREKRKEISSKDISIAKALQNKVPVRLGAQTDCFQPLEREEKVTYELIKYLNSIDYPYLVVTKSDIIGEKEYLDIIRKDLAYVQMTITTLDRNKADSLEPGAPAPEKRLLSMENLLNNGIFVAGRLSPVIPNITEEDLPEIINKLEKLGCEHIIFELFRGSLEMVDEVEVSVGKPVYPLEEKGFYFRLFEKEKNEMYYYFASLLENKDMTFSFCSDGTHVPYELQGSVNCCGTDVLLKKIPETKFSHGNERIAPTLYYELLDREKVSMEDMEDYFTFTAQSFKKAWYDGELINYIPGSIWDENEKAYRKRKQI